MSRDWVTFDCYGTLADWLGGMRNPLVPHVGAEAAERLLHAYHDLEADVEAQRPAPAYREVLRETLRRAAEREGIELPPGSEGVLVEHWPEVPIFDDTVPALTALRDAVWSLAILSNCDDDLLATTLERMPVSFDLTVTAEQVGSYKPDPGHWRAFEQRTEGDRGRWVHAAQSWFHDIVTAAELGLPSVWIPRGRRCGSGS
jgi:2-haloacid dehalogenase